jgi:hypothetical protein
MEKEGRFSRVFYAAFVFIYIIVIGLYWYFGVKPPRVVNLGDRVFATVVLSVFVALMGYVMARLGRRA